MAMARMRRACLASAVRAASARNREILRSWRVISIADMMPAPRIIDGLHRVTFADGWESHRSQVLRRLVLWAVLSVSDVSGPQALRQNVGRLGDEEVQTVERPQDTGEPLPRKHRGKASRSVRALAEGGGWQARLMGAV